MRWFGGHVGRGTTALLPADGRLLWADPVVWVAGKWSPYHVRIAHDDVAAVIVIGPCSATAAELARLLDVLPDSALVAWAGAYTIIGVVRGGPVTILTDPAGACLIYTTRSGDGALVWASSSWALASLAGGQVDDGWLAASLLSPTAAVPGRSAWTAVTLLPPGHRITAHADRPPALRTAWQPARRSLADAIARLRDTLAAGVRVRVDGVVPAADLSGGLDSTTLALMAAQVGSIAAVTVHPADITDGGDLDHARSAAAACKALRHLLLPLDDRHLPYTGLAGSEALPVTDEPAPSSLTWAMFSAELRLLAEAGVDSHLTGDGGDTLFFPPPVYLADLARTRRWLRLAADVQAWARLRRVSPWPMLTAAMSGDVGHLAGVAAAHGLTPVATELAAAVGTEDGLPGAGFADRALLAEVRQVARTAHSEAQLADAFGIALHNPYLDARVVDAVLGVPADLRTSPRRYKPLLTEVARGLLPEPVRLRAAKGVFVGDHHRGLRANLPHVLDLADGHLADRGLADPQRLDRQIRRAALGLDTNWGRLEPLLCAELWLRTVAAVPPVPWTHWHGHE